jgi:hypothetical protein
MSQAWERGPFGQRLSILLHRLPRAITAPLDWELERGFHLRLLSDALFELSLRPRGPTDSATLPLLKPDVSGVCRLLIWHKDPQDERWQAFSEQLTSPTAWQGALILSPSQQRRTAWASWARRRRASVGAACPVVELFQDSPPATFFTVEKNLFVLGRVGRRVERYARFRRLWPW